MTTPRLSKEKENIIRNSITPGWEVDLLNELDATRLELKKLQETKPDMRAWGLKIARIAHGWGSRGTHVSCDEDGESDFAGMLSAALKEAGPPPKIDRELLRAVIRAAETTAEACWPTSDGECDSVIDEVLRAKGES